MAVLYSLQVLAMSVAEGLKSSPGCTADGGRVGGEGRSGIVCRSSPLASESILIPDVVVRVVVGSHKVAQLPKYVPQHHGEVASLVH